MENLLNCHCKGLHSFPVSLENGLYKRVFLTDPDHDMWKPFEIAIHPHHVDIKITVLLGSIFNPIYEINLYGDNFKSFKWESHIETGAGGFKRLNDEKLVEISNDIIFAGQSKTMKACELHTVRVVKGRMVAWLIEESIPTCEYFPINYSPHDLEKWTPAGLYQKVSDDVRLKYFEAYSIDYLLK